MRRLQPYSENFIHCVNHSVHIMWSSAAPTAQPRPRFSSKKYFQRYSKIIRKSLPNPPQSLQNALKCHPRTPSGTVLEQKIAKALTFVPLASPKLPTRSQSLQKSMPKGSQKVPRSPPECLPESCPEPGILIFQNRYSRLDGNTILGTCLSMGTGSAFRIIKVMQASQTYFKIF